jgi:sec-independent protein translocase protein TatB
MMGISMQEFLLIAIVTLVVVGPKELPRMMRTLARGFGMVQRAAGEFRRQMDQMVRDSELEALRRDIEDAASDRPVSRRQAPPPPVPKASVTAAAPVVPEPAAAEPSSTPPSG